LKMTNVTAGLVENRYALSRKVDSRQENFGHAIRKWFGPNATLECPGDNLP
jgi:hypothetical protein